MEGPLPPGVYKRGNQIFIPAVQIHHAGDYICSVNHQFGKSESNSGRLDVNKGTFWDVINNALLLFFSAFKTNGGPT